MPDTTCWFDGSAAQRKLARAKGEEQLKQLVTAPVNLSILKVNKSEMKKLLNQLFFAVQQLNSEHRRSPRKGLQRTRSGKSLLGGECSREQEAIPREKMPANVSATTVLQ